MNKIKFVKSITVIVLLSCSLVGASFAKPALSQNESDKNLAQRYGLANSDSSRDSYSHNEIQKSQHGIQISIYQRDQYASQSRSDSVLSNMSSGERQAVRYFQNQPNRQRFVLVTNKNRQQVYYRSDYPQWLLRS